MANRLVPISVWATQSMPFGYVLKKISWLSLSQHIKQGVFESKNYAIFQSKPLGISWLSPAENAESLLHELKMLSMAQYFLNSYKARAALYKFTVLPGM